MKDRSDYNKAIEVIGKVIRAWDPYCLLAEGAPEDEFDGQIARITAKVPSFSSASDVAETISQVFTASFGSGEGFTPSNCLAPASQIFSALLDEKLGPAA